ncbi:F-box protein At5g07610-like isoform X2 [Triticum dicoccoides]|uniref:F-box protein At5g07610-like isoform X2 n=1 Tax=Triticum dicoccoides TaxID=85692 RepID=UPI0018917343|nr:F-box protein At5g07610-like isoform X2 [Triticum dicoccoides]
MEEAEKGELLERNTKPRLDSHPGPMVGLPLLTDDLILEILSRLPVRSLHRFKCVSVSWRDLITDPANRKKLPQTLAGFFYMTINNRIGHHFASVSGDSAAPFNLSIPYLHSNKYGGITQLDACNGLLLYCGFKKKMESWDDFCFLVCNPATGRPFRELTSQE